MFPSILVLHLGACFLSSIYFHCNPFRSYYPLSSLANADNKSRIFVYLKQIHAILRLQSAGKLCCLQSR